jgi:DNA helicase HerA-like ATPase
MERQSLIIGRSRDDTQMFGTCDAFLFGRTIGDEHRNIYFDALYQHLVLIFGKKGFGKSYTMAMLAEGLNSIEDTGNISVIMVDTMATFSGLGEPAEEKLDLLEAYGLPPKGFDIRIYLPHAWLVALEEYGLAQRILRSDWVAKLLIRPGDLEVFDWCQLFDLPRNAPSGLLLEKAVRSIKRSSGKAFSLSDLRNRVDEVGTELGFQSNTIQAVENRLDAAEEWGLFSPDATLLEQIAEGGRISILDLSYMSHITAGWTVRGLIVALLARQILRRRMIADRVERGEFGILPDHIAQRVRFPKVWMMIDEAHQFLPSGYSVISSEPLLEWVRQGRKPGLSLLLATQRPSRLHEDAISQGDVVISHTLTAKVDIDALRTLNQTWMKQGIESYILGMPKDQGNAIIFDDTNKEVLTIKVRVRQSREEGSTATAMTPEQFRKIKEQHEVKRLEQELGFA